jgi:hypothetical protein
MTDVKASRTRDSRLGIRPRPLDCRTNFEQSATIIKSTIAYYEFEFRKPPWLTASSPANFMAWLAESDTSRFSPHEKDYLLDNARIGPNGGL